MLKVLDECQHAPNGEGSRSGLKPDAGDQLLSYLSKIELRGLDPSTKSC
jgi:hypothetical protein